VIVMKETRVSLPELALIAGTRALLGAGIGLLLASSLPEGQRKAVGWTLLLIGGLTTIPLAIEVLGGGRLSAPAERPLPQGAGELQSEPFERFGQRGAIARG
jgi:hypothetical protein